MYSLMNRFEKESFGTLEDGRPVTRYSLRNDQGMVVKLTDYGATLTELHVPDREGHPRNIVHGFDNFEQYAKGHPYFGSTIGRVANRIAGARFSLNGEDYRLAANDGDHHLHGGLRGFNRVLWQAEQVQPAPDRVGVKFTYTSVDGEEGYPGNLSVTVTYTLSSHNELQLDYAATTDKATPINLTNHSYFNFAGHGDVLGHELTVIADHYTPTDDQLIPTGTIAPVADTPLDFTAPERIGARIEQLTPKPGGYDHNFVLNSRGKSLALAGRLYEPNSGRIMELYTTEPGLQVYTANNLDGTFNGIGGIPYDRHSAVCLETQHFPDSVHHSNFPSIVLEPGKDHRSSTVFNFSTR